MNKHYINALVLAAVAALADKQIEASEDDVKTFIDDDNLTGNFDDDLRCLVTACEAQSWDDEEEPEDNSPLACMTQQKEAVEQDIDKVVSSLKIGYNFIPGIGAGWCRNEEDLEKMRDFVRGALTVQAMGGASFPCCD